MSIAQSPRRSRLSLVILTTALLLTSTLAIINHVALFRLKEDVERWLQTSVDRTQMSIHEEKLAALENRINAIAGQPAPLTEDRFGVERQALEQQLKDVEHQLAGFARTSDIDELRDQLRGLERRLVKTQRADVNPARTAAAPAQATVIEPSFAVLGVELRGGERFVATQPLESRSLTDVRLLRVGETQDGWRLETLDATTAVFQQGDRRHRFKLQ